MARPPPPACGPLHELMGQRAEPAWGGALACLDGRHREEQGEAQEKRDRGKTTGRTRHTNLLIAGTKTGARMADSARRDRFTQFRKFEEEKRCKVERNAPFQSNRI